MSQNKTEQCKDGTEQCYVRGCEKDAEIKIQSRVNRKVQKACESCGESIASHTSNPYEVISRSLHTDTDHSEELR